MQKVLKWCIVAWESWGMSTMNGNRQSRKWCENTWFKNSFNKVSVANGMVVHLKPCDDYTCRRYLCLNTDSQTLHICNLDYFSEWTTQSHTAAQLGTSGRTFQVIFLIMVSVFRLRAFIQDLNTNPTQNWDWTNPVHVLFTDPNQTLLQVQFEHDELHQCHRNVQEEEHRLEESAIYKICYRLSIHWKRSNRP